MARFFDRGRSGQGYGRGAEIATLKVAVEGMEPRLIPLVAEADVGKGGFLTRLSSAAGALLARYLGGEAASL